MSAKKSNRIDKPWKKLSINCMYPFIRAYCSSRAFRNHIPVASNNNSAFKMSECYQNIEHSSRTRAKNKNENEKEIEMGKNTRTKESDRAKEAREREEKTLSSFRMKRAKYTNTCERTMQGIKWKKKQRWSSSSRSRNTIKSIQTAHEWMCLWWRYNVTGERIAPLYGVCAWFTLHSVVPFVYMSWFVSPNENVLRCDGSSHPENAM